MEVWKDIEGFEGYYQVSNYGRCKSLDRTVKQMSRWGKEIEVVYKASIMKLHISPKGYRYIQLCKEHIYYTFYVHRLVWETFNGKIPKELEIDHIKPISDGGGDELTNLRIGTRKDNMHNENTIAKYLKRIDQIDTITGEVVCQLDSAKDARKNGFNHCYQVANGKRKQDKGYIFKYPMI